MSLLLQDRFCLDIETTAEWTHNTFAKAEKIYLGRGLATTRKVEPLCAEEVGMLLADGLKKHSEEFVAFERVGDGQEVLGEQVAAVAGAVGALYRNGRLARSTTLQLSAVLAASRRVRPGQRADGADDARAWAHDAPRMCGTQKAIFDPVTGTPIKASVYRGALPYSGVVLTCGCLNVKMPNWVDAHRGLRVLRRRRPCDRSR